jgi:hypothetical protein
MLPEDGRVVAEPEAGPGGTELFAALVPAFEAAGVGMRSPLVAGQGGNVMELGPATRMMRSEVIVYAAAHKARPSPRTNWTRLVHPPVLIGHVSSIPPY